MNPLFICAVVALVICACAVFYHPRSKAAPVTEEQIRAAMEARAFAVVKTPFMQLYPARLAVPSLDLEIHILAVDQVRTMQRGRNWLTVSDTTRDAIVTAYLAEIWMEPVCPPNASKN